MKHKTFFWFVLPSTLAMLLFIFVALVLGRMDTKLGMRKEEYRNHASENPITMEILTSLRDIKANQIIQ